MALSYNLKYKKLNFFQRILLEKEGEIIIDRQAFKLRGKGARDFGEMVYFADIKEIQIPHDDEIQILTYKKERFILNGFSNLFESFLRDFFRVRNEFLSENLMMKVGMLIREYEGSVHIESRFGKTFNRGVSKIQLYEGSMVIMPETSDAFVIYFHFLKHHELDDMDYALKISLENGDVVALSKFGTMFEDFQETLESLLGKMYEKVMNRLKEYFVELPVAQLLKLASLVREGKSLTMQQLKKIDESLPKKLCEELYKDRPTTKEMADFLVSYDGGSIQYIGFTFVASKKDPREFEVKCWTVIALPQQNVMAFCMPSADSSFYFFRIVAEIGDREEKLNEKVMELNQSLYLFHYDPTLLVKDKRDLRRSKYRYAMKKLAYVRLLRKSLVARGFDRSLESFRQDFERAMDLASVNLKQIQATPVAVGTVIQSESVKVNSKVATKKPSKTSAVKKITKS